MIALHDLRHFWDEWQSTLSKTIEHLETQDRLHAVEAHTDRAFEVWLETLRSWKRDVEALQIEHRNPG